MPISRVLLAAEGYRSVESWLSRLAPATARMNRHDIGYFMKWLNENGASFKDYTPDQLVEYQKNTTNGQQYDTLDFVQRWVQTINGRYETKRHNITLLGPSSLTIARASWNQNLAK